MTKTETLSFLNANATTTPGLFTIEQVIAIVKNIDDAPTGTSNMTADERNDLADIIASAIALMGMNAVDKYDLSMDNNFVDVMSIDLNESSIYDKTRAAINQYFLNKA